MMEVLKLVVSACIGGGVAGGIMNWYLQRRDRQEDRHIQAVRDRLEKLYGPIYFFTSQNEECFRLCDTFHKTLHSDKLHTVNNDGHRQCYLRTEEIDEAIEISNDYVAMVRTNNDQIMGLLRHNWACGEPQDIPIFRQMMVDYIRNTTEFPAGKKMRTPLLMYREIGEVAFMRPEFMDRIRERVEEMQRTLEPARTSQSAKRWRILGRTARDPQHRTSSGQA